MIVESELFNVCQETLRIIENCAEKIYPDVTDLVQWFISYAADHKERLAFDLDIVRRHLPQGTRVLEVGSIPLLLTSALASCHYSVIGIDLAPERFASSISQLGLTVLKCDIEREGLLLQEDSVDAVIFNELFEHLRINPIFSLSEVFRVIKPGGILFLSSPNLRSFMGIMNLLLRNRGYSCAGDPYTEFEKLLKLGHMGHVREYTSFELIDFLQKVGFVIDRIIYRGRYRSKKSQLLLQVFPSLRPFISYIGKKPARV